MERFIAPCDFFTIDVAEEIGKPAKPEDVDAFVARHPELVGEVRIPRIAAPFKTDTAFVKGVANKFLAAVQDAGRIYLFLRRRRARASLCLRCRWMRRTRRRRRWSC